MSDWVIYVGIGLTLLAMMYMDIFDVFGATESECVSVKTDTLVIVDGNEVRDCSEWVEKFSNLGFKVTDMEIAPNRISQIVMQK